MHTIEAFCNCTPRPEILIVLHPDFHAYWKELCADHQFTIPHQLIAGGETRFHSVKNGLDVTADDSIIAIHDAVRPLTDTAIIEEAYKQASAHGNAVVAVKSRDSIRQGNSERSVSLLRDEIYLVQTPQTFRSDIIKNAYQQAYQEIFTDDASVAEQNGVQIKLIEGSYNNIKITFPEDIAIAELLLKQKSH
jgi:2-C-methyl-D-erythritol 4-phosphate cytidylyltransferase